MNDTEPDRPEPVELAADSPAGWKRPFVAMAVLAALVGVLVVVSRLSGGEPQEGSSAREEAIQRQIEVFGVPRQEVLDMAGTFCDQIRASDSFAEYEASVGQIFDEQGLAFLFADQSEMMVRIGECEDDYVAIGGVLGAGRDQAERAEAEVDAEANPSTPIPVLGDGGTAALLLENGERFDFDASCSLTYDEAPGMSIRYGVFADDGTVRLEAIAVPFEEEHPGVDPGEWFVISVFDSGTYEELWSASTILGDDLAVDVDGSDITATGTFFEGGLDGRAVGGESTLGTLTATCDSGSPATPRVSADDGAATTDEAAPVGESSQDASRFDAADVVLRADDLPAGWSETSVEDASGAPEPTDESEDCFEQVFRDAGFDADELEPSGRDLARARFIHQVDGAVPTFLFAEVSNTPQATDLIEFMPDALAACDGQPDDEGNPRTLVLLDPPLPGERSLAFRYDVEGDVPVALVYGVVVRGNVAVLAAHGGTPGRADRGLVNAALATMLGRL